jgi:hypothetical protein
MIYFRIIFITGLSGMILWLGSSDNPFDKFIMMFFIFILIITLLKIENEDTRRREIRDIREYRREYMRELNQESPNRNIIRQYISSVDEAEIVNSEKCVICLDDYDYDNNVGKLRCNHCYHQKCIERWLMEKTVCPLCKYNVLSSDNRELVLDDNSDNVEHIVSGNNEMPLQIIIR